MNKGEGTATCPECGRIQKTYDGHFLIHASEPGGSHGCAGSLCPADAYSSFEDVVAGIEIEDGTPQNYRGMRNDELIAAWLRAKASLIDRGVALHPNTDEDIDLQARYYGMLQELDRRGLRPK